MKSLTSIRYADPAAFIGYNSSWHCAETTAFVALLGATKAGAGRKTLKGALACRFHGIAATEAGKRACVRYIFPESVCAPVLQAACDAWNAKAAGTATAEVSCSLYDSLGCPVRFEIVLTLNGWGLAPRKTKDGGANV